MNPVQEILSKLVKVMSQGEIADAIGVSQSKVSRWLSGQIPAGADGAIRLLDLAKNKGVMEAPATTGQPVEA